MAKVKCEQEEPSTENYEWLKEWTEPEDAKGDFKLENDIIDSDYENNQKLKVAKSHGPTCTRDALLDNVGKSKDLQSSIEECVSRKNVKKRPSKETLKIDLLIEKLCKGATISGKVFNMCIFQCLKCGISLNAWKALMEHMAKVCFQKLTMTEVDRYITRAICHVCKVCSDKILCDRTMIIRHLRTKHKMISSFLQQKTRKCFCFKMEKEIDFLNYNGMGKEYQR